MPRLSRGFALRVETTAVLPTPLEATPQRVRGNFGDIWAFGETRIDRVTLAATQRLDDALVVAVGTAHRVDASPGVRLSSAELAAALHNDESIRRLVGQFAAAVIRVGTDRTDVRVARDPLGVYRVVWIRDGRFVYIGSSHAALLHVFQGVLTISDSGVAGFITLGGILGPGGTTLWKEVQHVPPGHFLQIDPPVAPRVVPYWNPVASRVRCDRLAAANHVRELVVAATKRAVPEAGAVCVDVSGGLDSSTVACTTAEWARREGILDRFVAYSLVGHHTAPEDEREYQEQVTERCGFGLHRTFDIDYLPDALDLHPHHPPSLASAQPWGRAAHEQLRTAYGAQTCLTGHGGDAVFCGFYAPADLAELFWSGQLMRWWQTVWSWLQTGRFAPASLLATYTAGQVGRYLSAAPAPPEWLTPRFADAVRDAERGFRTRRTGAFNADSGAFHLQLIENVAEGLPESDEAVMEFRHPLLDEALVGFVAGLPWHFKVLPTQTRVIQRDAFREMVPGPVIERRSKGLFTYRLFLLLEREWETLRTFSGGRCLADLGVIEPARFEAACARIAHGLSDRNVHRTFAALILEAWLSTGQGGSAGGRDDLLR